ncbi:MAG: helix-turn-helix transcriptional regulator [Chitinophagales bacterium]
MKAIHTTSNRQWWLKEINRLILNHLSDYNLTNTLLAEKLSVSERQLYRMVKNLTGMSPNLYVRHIRLQKAYQFLQSGEYRTVKEVAAKVGFQNAEYFTHLFKSTFGQIPFEVLQKKGIK